MRTMEAQVAEKRQQDIPFRQYIKDLVNNPRIFNEDAFESATIRSMQSNGIIREFVDNLIEKISEKGFSKSDFSLSPSPLRQLRYHIHLYDILFGNNLGT